MKKLHTILTTFISSSLLFNAIGQTTPPAPASGWPVTYNGPAGKTDGARKMIIDKDNNIYVIGRSDDRRGQDIATIKYNVSGQQLWAKRYNGPGSGNDYPNGIDVGADGYVYVTGRCVGLSGNEDYVTIKYNPANGDTMWTRKYNGNSNLNDNARDVKVDADGNIFVTGYANTTIQAVSNGTSIVTIKYNPDGIEAWNRTYDQSSEGESGNSLAIDADGNIYVAGQSNGSVLIKYDNSGGFKWAQNATEGGACQKVLIDGENNVITTGWGGTTIKYNSDGGEIWQTTFSDSYNATASFGDMALDASGNIYVTGTYHRPGLYSDYIIAKYSASDGALAWSKTFGGTQSATETDIARAIALDNAGNVYVSGYCTMAGARNSTTVNYGTIKYNADGVLQWTTPALHPGHAFDLAFDNAGNLYVTGESSGKTSTDFGTIKYSAGSIASSKSITSTPVAESQQLRFSLQNYPNPFMQSTTIEYQISYEAKVKLSVYDLQGKQIAILVDKNQSAGIYRVNFSANKLPAGTYIYKIQAGEVVETKKLIITR